MDWGGSGGDPVRVVRPEQKDRGRLPFLASDIRGVARILNGHRLELAVSEAPIGWTGADLGRGGASGHAS
jgi:hypothetical protein